MILGTTIIFGTVGHFKYSFLNCSVKATESEAMSLKNRDAHGPGHAELSRPACMTSQKPPQKETRPT